MPRGYRIRALRADDAPALAEAYRRNAEHLARWDPRRSASFFTDEGQAAVVAEHLEAVAGGRMAAWVLTRDGLLVGRVNLNNIVRGALCGGALGYWVDADHQGIGLASAAVRFACDAARARGLHRVEAGTLVHNLASQRVLRKCGFERYGLAPAYLCIDGAWQDHVLYQRILHDDPC